MNNLYSKFFKRILDVFFSLILLILLGWLYGIVALLVRIKLGSPVIFRQERPGRGEKIFKLYKFRTMTDRKDQDGNLLSDEERLTPFGKKLRSTSLDELPELVNILRGDMSFVGPRPLLVRYIPRYNEEQRHRHDVRPGLTGWAQVNGRNLLSWEEKFNKDIYYVNNISLWLDLKIIFMTIAVVFRHKDINSNTNATMEEFMGSEPDKVS